MKSRFIVCLAISLAFPALSVGAADEPAEADAALSAKVRQLDQQLFDAYNHCDLATFGRMVAPDIEFYHDKGGVTLGRDKLVATIKNNICGQLTRQLVPGSLQVYPIAHYGALELGEHRFCEVSSGKCDAVGRFVQLWHQGPEGWQLSRVISYDHHQEAETPAH